MKLLLLRVLLQRRAQDEGFTLPMVIALGLVMLLLGAVNITSANEENLNAIIKNSRSDALAIAEVGVARYRELLDRNRVLAVYDDTAWATVINDGSVILADLGLAEFCNGDIADFYRGQQNRITVSEDGEDFNNNGNNTDVFSGVTDSFPTGQYELVSYEYSNADGVFNMIDDSLNANATGTLTVKGITPDDGGEAQIEVDIPLRINLGDMNNIAPALWVNNNEITAANLGNLTITDGNLVIRDRALTTAGSEDDGCDDDSTLAALANDPRNNISVVSDPRNIPSIQQVITDVDNAEDVAAGDLTNDLPATTIASPIGAFPPNSVLLLGIRTANAFRPPDPGLDTAAVEDYLANFDTNPNTGDCSNIRLCRYYYDPGGINYTDLNLLNDGIAKSTILVDGTMNITANSRNVTIGSTSPLASSDAFEIYIRGNNNITIDVNGGRTVNINAFIHAPNSTLTITGSGTVNIRGSVWVDDFVNTTATVNITPDDSNISSTSFSKAYNFYTTTNSRTPRPLTGSPTNWKTEEAN